MWQYSVIRPLAGTDVNKAKTVDAKNYSSAYSSAGIEAE
jgi:hypothetical protein